MVSTSKPYSVLITDDDRGCREALREIMEPEGFHTWLASSGEEALSIVRDEPIHLAFLDMNMPTLTGLETLELVRQFNELLPVILVTVEQEIATVVEAVRCGATNYLTKPVSPGALRAAALRALASHAPGRAALARNAPEIVGSSPAIVSVRHLVSLAARSDANVLITGETGTGKELVARAIHRLSSLAAGPFVPHNCAVSPHDLFESQFFGHRRGAFTGAERDHRGLLEEADGGILFLDELECLSLAHQAKLAGVDFQSAARHPDEFEGRKLQAAYYAMVEMIDDGLGQMERTGAAQEGRHAIGKDAAVGRHRPVPVGGRRDAGPSRSANRRCTRTRRARAASGSVLGTV